MSEKAHRIPEDFALTDERRAIAEKRGLDADRAFEDFFCFWSSLDERSAKAKKSNWHRTWINACNNYEHWGKFKKKEAPIPVQPMKLAPRMIARAEILDRPEPANRIDQAKVNQLRAALHGKLKTLQ